VASIDKVDTGWRARWRTPDGESRSKTFKRKVDAENHLTSVQHSKLTGGYVDPSAGRVTFKTFAEGWRAAQVHRPQTASQIETNLRRHVYPRIGHRPIGAIRPSEIQGLVKSLSGGTDQRQLAPATVDVIYTWLATIFKAAVLDMVISKTPCQQVKLPAVEHKKVIPLPVETIEALIDAVPVRFRALIVLGAGTGVRISEALGLTNDRIDWMRRTLTVDRQLTGIDADRSPLFGPVKDKKNRPRTIPLPQTVLDELSVHVGRFGLGPADLLFTGTRGGPMGRTTFSEVWMAAAGPLGIPLGDGYHQLRHFYASVLIRAGESVKVVQERLGHTSAQMTLDVYSHLWPEDEDRTRAAVDAVLGAGQRDTNVTQESAK
jgi:integrase